LRAARDASVTTPRVSLNSFGPAIAFAIAAACPRVRQPSFFAPLQTSVCGLKPHACVSKIMPSSRPSSASHASSSPSITSSRSFSESALPGTTLPLASRAATAFPDQSPGGARANRIAYSTPATPMRRSSSPSTRQCAGSMPVNVERPDGGVARAAAMCSARVISSATPGGETAASFEHAADI
jgi:hypothetical protein